jgi:2-aminoethylphosphonate aminotransferase
MNPARKILLNPGPVTTTNTVKQALVVSDICHREAEFGDIVLSVRQDLKRIVHADEKYTTVVFASSGTGAVESVIGSVIPLNKKCLVISNGIYGTRIMDIAQNLRIPLVELNYSYDDQPLIADVYNMLSNDTDIAAVAMVHHETSTGMLNPIAAIGKIAADHDRTFIVDAISSYAGIPINIQECFVDYLIGTSNKCLQGMPGISFVIANKHNLLQHSNHNRGYYFDLYRQYESLEKNNLLRFTPPVQVFYALRQAIDEYFAEGENERFKRIKENYAALIAGLAELEFEFLIPSPYHSQLLVLARYKHEFNFVKCHNYLYKKGFTIYPASLHLDNTFRLACFGELHKKDIELFIQQLKEFLCLKIEANRN